MLLTGVGVGVQDLREAPQFPGNSARKCDAAGVRGAFRNTSLPQQRRQKMCLIRANHTSVGRPQEEGMMSVAASFPQF